MTIRPQNRVNGPRGLIESLYGMIAGNFCSSFIIGIEYNGERIFVKSDNAAALIGNLYRAALRQERPQALPSKFLSFPDIDHFVNPGNFRGEYANRQKTGMLQQ